MKTHIFPAIRLTAICFIFFCGLYTLMVWSFAQLVPNKGKGGTIIINNKTYYTNIAQKFNQDKYFWSRPSAVDYNAAGAGGSNKGPSNPDYLAQVQARIDSFMIHNPGIKKADIPADIVTASGSGLDPDISIQSAKVQVQRIASKRQIPVTAIEQLIAKNTKQPLLGLFGPASINVLQLNLALDALANNK
jgi:K+-transporting ATPase ATPase C chain